jgi:hypothetical protein
VDSSLYGIFWGIAVPATILLGSFALSLWLYRRFTRPAREEGK